MNEQAILTILQKSVVAAQAACGNTLPVKFVGLTLDTPATRYLETVYIPNNRNDYWNDERVYQGTFRIILHWDIDETGAYPPLAAIDALAAFYTKDNRLTHSDAPGVSVQIYGVPDGSGPIETGSELLFPLTLQYRCFGA